MTRRRPLLNHASPARPASECSSGKNQYWSEAEAEAARDYREEQSGVLLAVYRCAECLAWHLTSKLENE